MSAPDPTEPIALHYAASGSDSRPRLRSPARPWLLARVALFISTTAFPIIVLARDVPFLASAVIGMLSSVLALFLMIIAMGRNTQQQPSSIGRLSMRYCVAALVAAVAFLGFNGWTCAKLDRRIHDGNYSTMAVYQLRMIADRVDEYRQDHGTYPSRPEDLVTAKLATDLSLVLPMDAQGWLSLGSPPIIPSYILRPQARAPNAPPHTIHIYERQPWSVDGIRLFQQKQHAVVYADGTSALLSPADLAAQLSIGPP